MVGTFQRWAATRHTTNMSGSDSDSSPLGYNKDLWFECAYVLNFKFPIPKSLVCDGMEVGDLEYHPDLMQDRGFEIDLNATPTMTLRFTSGLTQKVVALWQAYDYKYEHISEHPEKKQEYHLTHTME